MLLKFGINFVFLACFGVFAHDFEKNVLKTWKNNTFYGFRGIKYAESPTNERRFRAPVPIKSWNNISMILEQPLNTDGSDCPSPKTSNAPEYNEDCLYLNVYTKRFNSTDLDPVVVFIHPGGFYVGSGSSVTYGPEYLLEEDIVLVTFNYRLAFFGFTSIGTPDAIGNAGFKDQALVLKWVQDHIRHFGGDAQRVTLMGCSSGGMSVALHMISPISRNLFHRAFLMSGGILPQTKTQTAQLDLVEKLARFIGCSKDKFDCIKQSGTREITESLRKVFDFGYDNPIYPWLPVIESRIDGEEQFLDADPLQQLQDGNFNQIPILISRTKDEAASSALYLFEHRNLLNEWVNDFARVGPICLHYEPNATISAEIKKRFVNYTINDRQHYNQFFDQTVQCFSDAMTNFPMYRFAQLTKRLTDVYYMKFNFRGAFSSFKCNSTINRDLCDDINKKQIVDHTDDLQYLFTSKSVPQFNIGSSEARTVEKYTKLLVSFAKNGYPYFGPEINVFGARFNNEEVFVKFGDEFELDRGPFKDYKFWNHLFAQKATN